MEHAPPSLYIVQVKGVHEPVRIGTPGISFGPPGNKFSPTRCHSRYSEGEVGGSLVSSTAPILCSPTADQE